MLNILRRASQNLFFKAILIAIVLSFVLWGVGDILRANHSNSVAEVGDTNISQEAFQQRFQDELQRLQTAFGGKLSPEHLRAFRLEENILNQMISQTLLNERLDDLKILVSENAIYQSIAKHEAFHDEKGRFSAERFRTALKENGMSEKQFISDVTSSIREALLIRNLLATPAISSKSAELLATAQQEKRIVTSFSVPANSIKQIADPSDADLQKFYQENSQNFLVPEQRNIRFLIIKPEMIKIADNVDEEILKQRYEAEKERFSTPERRIIEHRVFASEEEAKKFQTTLAKTPLDSLGKGAIAIEESAISTLPTDLQQKIFSLPVKTASDILASPLGWHIFLTTKIEEAGIKSFAEVREQIKSEFKEQKLGEEFSALTQHAEELLATGNSLENVAKEIGGFVQSVNNISKSDPASSDEKTAKLLKDPAFIKAIFETNKGQVSPLVSLASIQNNIALIAVDEVQEERIKALDEIRGTAITLWKKAEKNRLLKVNANEFLKLATSKNANLEKIAQSNGLLVTSNLTISRPAQERAENPAKSSASNLIPPSLQRELFTLPLKALSTLHANDDGSYVLARAEKIITGEAKKEQILSSLEAQKQAFPDEAAAYYQQYLQKLYPVKINQNFLNNSK
jgi:peptidyl-prolyl cis-trans isomerase D